MQEEAIPNTEQSGVSSDPYPLTSNFVVIVLLKFIKLSDYVVNLCFCQNIEIFKVPMNKANDL